MITHIQRVLLLVGGRVVEGVEVFPGAFLKSGPNPRGSAADLGAAGRAFLRAMSCSKRNVG